MIMSIIKSGIRPLCSSPFGSTCIYTKFLGIITWHSIVLRGLWFGHGLEPNYRLYGPNIGGPMC